MKQKIPQRVLFPVVIVIWGIVFYRIFFYQPSDKGGSQQGSSVRSASIPNKHSFSQPLPELHLDYADPFTGLPTPSRRTSPTKSQKKVPSQAFKTKKAEVAPPSAWPSVAYLGRAINGGKKQKFGLIRVDKKIYSVSEGDQIKELKIQQIGEGHIRLKMGDSTQTFVLK